MLRGMPRPQFRWDSDAARFGTTSMGYAREVAELFLGRNARASLDQVWASPCCAGVLLRSRRCRSCWPVMGCAIVYVGRGCLRTAACRMPCSRWPLSMQHSLVCSARLVCGAWPRACLAYCTNDGALS